MKIGDFLWCNKNLYMSFGGGLAFAKGKAYRVTKTDGMHQPALCDEKGCDEHWIGGAWDQYFSSHNPDVWVDAFGVTHKHSDA